MRIVLDDIIWFYPEDWAHIDAYKRVVLHQKWLDPNFQVLDWVQLSDVQRANIRKANEEHWREMREFGERLRAK